MFFFSCFLPPFFGPQVISLFQLPNLFYSNAMHTFNRGKNKNIDVKQTKKKTDLSTKIFRSSSIRQIYFLFVKAPKHSANLKETDKSFKLSCSLSEECLNKCTREKKGNYKVEKLEDGRVRWVEGFFFFFFFTKPSID